MYATKYGNLFNENPRNGIYMKYIIENHFTILVAVHDKLGQ